MRLAKCCSLCVRAWGTALQSAGSGAASEPWVREVAPWQVACVLLPLCFLYDIFWVFLQPLLLGGPSVMVQACATRTHAALL